MYALTAALVVLGAMLGPTSAVAAQSGVRVPPESVVRECDAETEPIVVAADVAAQSDIYSAVTLAGVLGDTCIVFAGPRHEAMSADQQTRLRAAAGGGYIVGGTSAVSDLKVAGRRMARLGGVDRWQTALLVGREATRLHSTASASIPSADVLAAVTASATIDSGWKHSCALRTDRTMVCWGNNSRGQAEAPDGEFTMLSLGDEHSCALGVDRTAICWGLNDRGQTAAPQGRFTAIDTGVGDHGCALGMDRAVVCWGQDNHRQARDQRGEFTAIAVGSGYSCALRLDGTIQCWGLNNHGQTDAPSGEFVAVSAGGWHSCGLRVDGVVRCWGLDNHGRTKVPSGKFVAVEAGGAHSCGIRAGGEVTCWGANSWNDRPNGQGDAPAGDFIAVSAGVRHTCGIRTDGMLACWGSTGDEFGPPPPGQFGPGPTAASVNVAETAVRLPPTALREQCGPNTVPVVVASDFSAQSDIYSAVTLAGALGDACIVLAGGRHEAMPTDQRVQLEAAAAGGYVVGGTAAVGDAKLAGREMTRLGGKDRWTTALQVGQEASSAADL